MPLDPTMLLTEKGMLYMARKGSPEDKLALLDHEELSYDAHRLLVLESEPEVQEEAVRRCSWVPWLRELATHGPAPALRGLIHNLSFFPVESGPHPRLLSPWHYPMIIHPSDQYRPERQGFRHLLFVTDVMQPVEEDPVEELERLRGLDLDADEALRQECEAALVGFYTELMHRIAHNPALPEAGDDFLETYFSWWFRLPGDHLEETRKLFDQDDPAIARALASCWATPVPLLEQLLEKAYDRDDVTLRKALTWWARSTLPAEAQARLWADPDVQVRAQVLNYGLAPAEVMLRLARDPEIRAERLPQASSGSLSYEASKDFGEEFAQVIWERFGLKVDWYVH